METLFAIGVIVLILTGVITLIIKVMNSKSKVYDRKKATELAQVVVEKMNGLRKSNPEDFWQLSPVENQVWPGYDAYKYSISFSNIIEPGKCEIVNGRPDCVELKVEVFWEDNPNQKQVFTRFYSRK